MIEWAKWILEAHDIGKRDMIEDKLRIGEKWSRISQTFRNRTGWSWDNLEQVIESILHRRRRTSHKTKMQRLIGMHWWLIRFVKTFGTPKNKWLKTRLKKANRKIILVEDTIAKY